MRPLLLLAALLLLTRCNTVSQYDADKGYDHTSLQGSEGGDGVQTSIWSNDPDKTTITHQHPDASQQ
jgi:hypothetical protein